MIVRDDTDHTVAADKDNDAARVVSGLSCPQPRAGSDATPGTDQADSGDGEYRHLEPVLAAYAAMTPDDPDRGGLRERLITGFLPVARHLARRYAQRGEPLEDLEQVACLGLLNAIDRFEPRRGPHFLAYAIPTITGEIRRHFRDKTWSMRVPRRLKDLRLSINTVVAELTERRHGAPRPSDIAAQLDIPTDDVLEGLQASRAYQAGSLDETPNTADAAAPLGERLGESDEGFQRFTDSHSLAPHLAALPTQQREVLIMRFFGDMTQTQIGQRLNISQMQVSRLLTATLTQLREALNNDTPPPGTDTGSTVAGARSKPDHLAAYTGSDSTPPPDTMAKPTVGTRPQRRTARGHRAR
jgi:RNA polymerase sigma-B factor